MQRRAGGGEQFATSIEVHAVVHGSTVERALVGGHQPSGAQPAEVVGDEVLRLPDRLGELPDLAIAAGQLDEHPPAHRDDPRASGTGAPAQFPNGSS